MVDDEKSIRFALGHYFIQQGVDVDSAGDVPEARALLESTHYELAIVDIHLGGRNETEDGLDLAAFIRDFSPGTVVVILTGLESPASLRRAAEVGVRSFLRKPTPLAEVAEIAFAALEEQANRNLALAAVQA